MNLRAEPAVVNRRALDLKLELFYLFAVEFDLPIVMHRTQNGCAIERIAVRSVSVVGDNSINMPL